MTSFASYDNTKGYMAKESWLDFWKGPKRFSSKVFRLALEPTQLPIQWAPRALSQGKSSQGVKPITHSI
jgi:hypothetical protein